MFSIGFSEIIVIAIVALLFIGPKRLPEFMKQAGRFFVQARRMSNEVKSTVETVIRDAEESVRLEELEKTRKQPEIKPSQLLGDTQVP